jgi:hypothetical protein
LAAISRRKRILNITHPDGKFCAEHLDPALTETVTAGQTNVPYLPSKKNYGCGGGGHPPGEQCGHHPA